VQLQCNPLWANTQPVAVFDAAFSVFDAVQPAQNYKGSPPGGAGGKAFCDDNTP